MPSQVPGNEEGMPQADDRRDACVPESRGRAGNPSVWRRPDASQKPRHAARARPWPSHAHRVHQLSRAHELASREHRRHRMGPRAQGAWPTLGEEWPERRSADALCLSPRDRSENPSSAGRSSWGRGSCTTFAKTSLNCANVDS